MRSHGRALLSCMLVGAVLLLVSGVGRASSKEKKSSDRPKLPYNMMGLGRDELDAYDSKGEPVASATAALTAVNNSGWELIHKYFPALGTSPEGTEKKAHPDDLMDARMVAYRLSEDATDSPMPLLCAVWSLPGSDLSGRLKALHNDLDAAMTVEDYSIWKLDALRAAVNDMTEPAKTAQGVKYWRPKTKLSFAQALRLYAMTVALIRIETKWADKADSPPPDMADFSNRFRWQVPRRIADGETIAFFLYRPGIMSHPLSKDEFEERADVVVMKRKGSAFEVEQFPVYLTADEKEWNPAWIELKDEMADTTLLARKFEHDWTRLDGPYVWFRGDQLNGTVVYRSTAVFNSDGVTIEAEREIQSRGSVKRADRPRDYNPGLMSAFQPNVDTPAGPHSIFMIDPISIEDQGRNLKSVHYFSNAFIAWCTYGVSTSGLAGDGRTWVTVLPDQPRADAPQPAAQPKTAAQASSAPAASHP
jgi:hypothetical protein